MNQTQHQPGNKLWLVRHAKPLIAAGVCYGKLDIAADTEASRQSAAALAKQLPGQLRIVCSQLQRCRQFAHELLSLRPELTCDFDARLQEMDFGLWEGRAWQDIDPAELQAWTDDFAHYAPGGNGESVGRFMARVADAFDALSPTEDARGDTLWVTHAGVIRAVELIARGQRQIEEAGQWPLQAPDYGQWRTLDVHSGQRLDTQQKA